jgi:ABC-2 type transport system ATP-binding protein
MPEAEMLCDRVAFLRKGEVVALDTPENLKSSLNLGERLIIKYRGYVDSNAFEGIPGVLAVKCVPGCAEIVIEERSRSLDSIIKIFGETQILDLLIREPDLEDVFIELAK